VFFFYKFVNNLENNLRFWNQWCYSSNVIFVINLNNDNLILKRNTEQADHKKSLKWGVGWSGGWVGGSNIIITKKILKKVLASLVFHLKKS
jgi:hypothetical protein